MNNLSDNEIHQIVQRVVRQALGVVQAQSEDASAKPTAIAPTSSAAPTKRIIAIGSDHGGYDLKTALKPDLEALSFEILDVGTNSKDAVDYPDFAHVVARLVSSGKAWRGIMIDGAGIGSCIVANKVPGVRAGMAYDLSSALNSREHNDTNVLTLGAGMIGVNLAKQIVKTWLETEYAGGRHARRIEKILAIEKQYLK